MSYAPAFVSGVDECIHWRLRRDIQWSQIDQDDTPAWVASDPLTRKHYRIGDEEKFLLSQLDGNCDLKSLQKKFSMRFAPQCIDASSVIQLIGLAVQRGLLIGHRRDVLPTKSQQFRNASARVLRLPYSLLFARISFGNPEKWLAYIQSCDKYFIGTRAVLFWLGVFACSAFLVISRWTQFIDNIPSWRELVSPRTLLGFGAAFVFTRIVHELGHALACRAFGARCPDAGVFVMIGMACPYVDVSDSNRLSSRWQRATIAASGVYAEFIFAALAGFAWFATYEGPLHSFAWKILVVSSISTLLFNCNPLMRFDGYFLLCDFVGSANLRETASHAARHFFARCFFGPNETTDARPLFSSWLIAFGSASGVYRLSMLMGLCVAVWQMLHHFELSWLGTILVCTIIASSIIMPLFQSIHWTCNELGAGRLRPVRTAMGWLVLASLISIILFLPIPQRLACSGQIFPADESPLYTTADGICQSSIEVDAVDPQSVSAGQSILQIRNSAVDLAVLDAESRRSEIYGQLAATRRLAFSEPFAGDQLPKMESALETANQQLGHARRSQSELEISASRPGHFIAARAPSPNAVELADSHLVNSDTAAWDSESSQGRRIGIGTVIGWIRHSDQWIVRAYIDETQIPSVHPQLPVHIRLAQDPYRVYYGKVQRVAFQPSAETQPTHAKSQASDPSSVVVETTSRYMMETTLDVPSDSQFARAGQADLVVHSYSLPLATLIRNWLWRNLRMR